MFANPQTYGGDALRGLMLGIRNFGIVVDLIVLLAFVLVTMILGTWSFRRMKL